LFTWILDSKHNVNLPTSTHNVKRHWWSLCPICWLCPLGKKSLRIYAGFGDKILAQPWTTVWVTCGYSSAHIRWMGNFHHASRWNILHSILKVFGFTLNSPYKARSRRDELLVEDLSTGTYITRCVIHNGTVINLISTIDIVW
jgi:hypothetical protein